MREMSAMNAQAVQMKLRVQPELRDWISAKAKANKRSNTAEVEFLLEEARRRDAEKGRAAP